MKKILTMIALCGLLAVSCSKYDDSDLKNKYTSLESRLTILEKTVSDINSGIADVRKLASDGCVITEVKEVKDGDGNVASYEISLSDGSGITLVNGSEGAAGSTPLIGAAKDGDIFYWTVDGQWLLSGGQKVGCTAAAPQVRVTDAGRWEVSYDGSTWTDIGAATAGTSADSWFSSVTLADGFVLIKLKGSEDSLQIPYYPEKGFALVFESAQIEAVAGETTQVAYSIAGQNGSTTVGVINPGIFQVRFSDGKMLIDAPAGFEAGTITVYADNGLGASSIRTLTVTPYEAPVSQTLIFKDGFDWSTSTCNSVGTTANEFGWATLSTNGTNGWTCEPVGGNNNCWGRTGHIRFSRTNAGGILTSPALEKIEGTADLVVTFCAARWYNASSGANDANNYFTVSTSDSSKVCAAQDGTYSDKLTIEITNNYDVVDWQSASGAAYTFYVKGASASTKISWASTGSDGSTTFSGTGRLVLDNVEINAL